MKNIKVWCTVLLLAAFAFSGCSKKAKDINVNDLKSACDFVDAMELVLDEAADLAGGASTRAQLGEEKQTEFNALVDKLQEISEAADKQYKKSDAEKCPNFEKLQEKGDKLEGLFMGE